MQNVFRISLVRIQNQSKSRPHRYSDSAATSWIGSLTIGLLLLAISSPIYGQTPSTASSTTYAEGFTEPFITVVVASPESGVLQSLNVGEGDSIKQGDVVGRLDSQVLNASLNSAKEKLKSQGQINAAQAKLTSKTHHLDQMKTLLKREHASEKEVRQAQLDFDLAQANLEIASDQHRSLEMDVKQIEAQLERRTVRSPISGTVLELPRQVGEAISATDSEVATVVALDRLRVRYFLTTQLAGQLKNGQSVKVSFPETGQHTTARVDFVSPVTDAKSGTVRVELLIDNQDRSYRSGLRCLLNNIRATASKTPLNENRF